MRYKLMDTALEAAPAVLHPDDALPSTWRILDGRHALRVAPDGRRQAHYAAITYSPDAKRRDPSHVGAVICHAAKANVCQTFPSWISPQGRARKAYYAAEGTDIAAVDRQRRPIVDTSRSAFTGPPVHWEGSVEPEVQDWPGWMPPVALHPDDPLPPGWSLLERADGLYAFLEGYHPFPVRVELRGDAKRRTPGGINAALHNARHRKGAAEYQRRQAGDSPEPSRRPLAEAPEPTATDAVKIRLALARRYGVEEGARRWAALLRRFPRLG